MSVAAKSAIALELIMAIYIQGSSSIIKRQSRLVAVIALVIVNFSAKSATLKQNLTGGTNNYAS